jgi:serine/threonine protein kinase
VPNQAVASLSPENIIVDNRHTDPEFFLIDFDLSVSSSQNNKTPFRGTFQYIPPETEYESGVIMEGKALVRSFERWSEVDKYALRVTYESVKASILPCCVSLVGFIMTLNRRRMNAEQIAKRKLSTNEFKELLQSTNQELNRDCTRLQNTTNKWHTFQDMPFFQNERWADHTNASFDRFTEMISRKASQT